MMNLDEPKKMKFRLFCTEQYKQSLENYKEIVDVIIETLNKHNCEFLNQIINHLNILYAEFHEYNKVKSIEYFIKPKSLNYKKIWKNYCSDCIIEDMPEYEEDEEKKENEEGDGVVE